MKKRILPYLIAGLIGMAGLNGRTDAQAQYEGAEKGLQARVLQEREYEVSQKVLDAWVEFRKEAPNGIEINGFYQTDGKYSKETIDYLKEKFSKEISSMHDKNYSDSLFNILSTKGNIVISENAPKEILVHERMHKYMEENLTEKEKAGLREAQDNFVKWGSDRNNLEEITQIWTHKDGRVEYKTKKVTYFDRYIKDDDILSAIKNGNWSEFYAYIGAMEICPEGDLRQLIHLNIPYTFGQMHPEAKGIYNRMVEEVKEW